MQKRPRYFQVRILFSLLFFILILSNCEPREEIITRDSDAKLEFSVDSVLFDTIFTEVRNVTKRFKVYNRNNNALEVSNIRLQRGSNSPYQLIINGIEAKDFQNVQILGKDSIYVLVNVNIESPRSENDPFLEDDKIEFLTNTNVQTVHLRSYGQDAIFYNDEFVECDTVWNGQKPIVIINSIGISAGCKLTIQEGTKIYLDNSSSIFVEGTLEVLGSIENPVCFSGIRLEEDFEDIPGQWGQNSTQNGILFLDGSKDNIIDWAIIENSTTAIRMGGVYDVNRPDLRISNTIIKNMAGDGIISFGGDVIAYNNLITNCGNTGITLFLGGTHGIYHNTIANYSFTFNREDPGMIITDFFPDSTGNANEINPLVLDFQNNILWGNLEDEFLFSFQSESNTIQSANNFLKLSDETLIAFFQGNENIIENNTEILKFKDNRDYNFELDTLSPAKDAGNINVLDFIDSDLNNNPRNDGMPDMGAYERQD